MTAKLTPNLRLRNAQDFLENLVNHPITPPFTSADGSHAVDRNHYIFIGRTKPWPTSLYTNPVVSETSPPTPKNTLDEEMETRDHMIALKKVRIADATLAVKRHNWDSSGLTIYAPYDSSDPDLLNRPTQDEVQAANRDGSYRAGSHYVVTDDYHVFKCLSNGNGRKSTIKPVLPSNASYTVASTDGYVWKYLCTLTQFQVQYFLTNQWLPVKTLKVQDDSNQWRVQGAAVDGALESFNIVDAGSGYTNTLSGTLESASTSTATLPISISPSPVDNAYAGCHIWITGGAGLSSGPFVITSYSASSRSISISGTWSVDSSTSFEILPRVIIRGNGSGATAKAFVDSSSQKVSRVVAVSGGSGYTYATAEVVGGTTGSNAKIEAEISPRGGHGADIERELNACYVMLTARLPYDDGSNDFPLSNDYRQVGLIRNVEKPTGDLANSLTLRASRGLRLSNVSLTFQPDEEITGSNGTVVAKAKVIAAIAGATAGDVTIHYYQDADTGYVPFQDGMRVDGTFGASGSVQSGGVVVPEINKLSGDVLYIDNRRAILRAPNQTEILRAVIKF